MSKVLDQRYLRDNQYENDANLNARMALHQRFGTAKIGWHRWVFDQLELPPDAHILELGCRPGALWAQNLDRLPVGWEVLLSDFSLGMVEAARRTLSVSARPFFFAQCDAQAIPFAKARFDAVIANHMLYHVPDRQKAFAEIRRVLKPQGRFYAATNSRNTMSQIADLEAGLGIRGSVGAFTKADEFFGLVRGGAELEMWFSRVSLRRQEEALLVTESEPLIHYLQSVVDRADLTDEKLAVLRATVEGEIKNAGAFRIDKVTGLFTAETE